jgi:hypothetical protein
MITLTIFLTFSLSSFLDAVLLIWLLPYTSATSTGFNSGLDVILLFFGVTLLAQLAAIDLIQVQTNLQTGFLLTSAVILATIISGTSAAIGTAVVVVQCNSR